MTNVQLILTLECTTCGAKVDAHPASLTTIEDTGISYHVTRLVERLRAHQCVMGSKPK